MLLRHVMLLALTLTGVTACQRYERQPLQLTAYARSWAQRALDVEPVHVFAASLERTSDPGGPFDSTDGLSLHEAEAVALHFNPQLRAARAEAEVPLVGAKQAGWWPDPKFRAEVLRFLDRGDKTRVKPQGPSLDGLNAGGLETTPAGFRRVEGDFIDDPWILGAGLSFTLPISGRLAVEKELRWSQYSSAWRRILLTEWSLLTNLRDAWLKWSISKERSDTTREYLSKLEPIADIARQLMLAGEMKPTESRLLLIEVERRRTNILMFEGEVDQNRLALYAMMGLSPDAPISLQADVFVPPILVPLDQQQAALLENHPQIKSAEADYEIAEQQLQLEIRRQYPDLDLGPSYSMEEGLPRFGFGLGLTIPLWNRNRQAIAEAVAAREAAKVMAQMTVERVLSELAQEQTRLRYAGERRAMLLEHVAPLVEKQVADSRTLLELGEVDVLLLRDALTGSLTTKLELLDATLAEGTAANGLEQMLRPRWFTPSKAETKEEN